MQAFNQDDPFWRPFEFYQSLLEVLRTPELAKDVKELKGWLDR